VFNYTMKMVLAAAALGLALPATASTYKEVAVANGGSITGTLSAGKLKSDIRSFTISKDKAICGTGTRKVPFIEVNNGVLKNAVVFLYKVKEGKAFPKGLKTLTLNQKGCAFHPFFSVMENGGKITVKNDDGTLHNIHTYEEIGRARRTIFNVSQPNQGDHFVKTVKLRRGDGIKIECDAHDFMHGFIFVAKSPYYSVVDATGHFTIGDVPPGKYKIRVWHGAAGELKGGEVTVTAGGTTNMDLSY